MTKIDTKNLTIKETHEHLVKGDFTAVELAQAHLETIKEKDTEVHAYLEVYEDVLEQAKKADEVIAQEKENTPLLTGIPLAMKDNMLIKGRRASCGSKILEGYTATYDASITEQLKGENTVFLGRTNMDEFAMGSSTENSAFGPTKNPHDLSRVPGGSSGGSAAAVALGAALGAFGSDTGGSIRQPAGFCGVVGLKPTYGSVSRRGLVALASSLDQIGPFAKTSEDARILFNAVSGYDPKDSTSYQHKLRDKVRGESKRKKVIGVPYHLFEDIKGIDKDVLDNFNEAISLYEKNGFEIRTVRLPYTPHALSAYYVIMPAEASSNLARFDGVRYGLHKDGKDLLQDYRVTRGEGFGEEARRRILLGAYVLSAGYYDAYYNKAIAVRKSIQNDFKKAFDDVDVIMTPTTPTPAFTLGEKVDDPLAMYLSDIFTVSSNIAGIPGISVPSGTVDRDSIALPVGLQILAPHFGEDLLCDMGTLFEKINKS